MGDDDLIHRQLQEIFRTVLNDPGLVLASDATAATIPGWDSLSHITLMVAIEQEFGIRFRGNELAEMESIGELEAFLASGARRRQPRTRPEREPRESGH